MNGKVPQSATRGARFEHEIRTQYEAGDPMLLQHYASTIKALEEPDGTASSW